MSRNSRYDEGCFRSSVVAGLPLGFNVNAERGSYNEEVSVSLKPAYAFIQLNSKDRNTSTSSAVSLFTTEQQPWNSFRVQKPAPVLDSFGSRLGVSDIRFPWAIPNITSYNNKIYIKVNGSNTLLTVTVPVGFYSGTELATAINTAIESVSTEPYPTIAYNATTYTYTWTVPLTGDLIIYPFEDQSITAYYTQASLAKTLGMVLTQFGTLYEAGETIIGAVTQSLYTSYVDVVSEKLHYNNKVKDGSSAQTITSNILCRIMCSDETSQQTNWTTGQTPFLIHRQYMSPKMVRWNPKSFIDWFDIQIKDEFGNLVYLPDVSYPDFQITLLVSEV